MANKPNRKTALHSIIIELKSRLKTCQEIDENEAYTIKEMICICELFMQREKYYIEKAYKDGLEDMRVRKHYRPKDYFDFTFKEYKPWQGIIKY
jgi:hypothetical protein